MQLVVMGLIGNAGAAVLNLQAMIGGALRTAHALQALPQLLMRVRVSMQMDWNAGASAFLLAGIAGLGLIKTAGAKRAGVVVLLFVVAGGLWTTGSRIALVMGVGAALAAIGWLAAKADRRRLMVAGVALLFLGVGAWVVISGLSGRNTALPLSVELRWVMAKAGVQMFKEAPVFGIGISKFYSASAALAGPYLVSVGWRPNENAHNNFIQVLAEQGLAGLGALLWVLAIVLVGSARAQISTPSTLRAGLILAVVACVGTWLTGHPLLVPEFAFVFWFYCGILAALTPAVTLPRPGWLLWVLAAAVLVSVPVRAVALRNALYLEHQAIGLSVWQDSDAQRFQAAGRSFTLFLPSGGRGVEVPLRRAPGTPDPLVVDITIRGRLVDRVSIGGDAWQTVLVVVGNDARRFEAVDFAVRPPASRAEVPEVLLRVGRTVAR